MLKQFEIEEIDGSLNRQNRLEQGDFVVHLNSYNTFIEDERKQVQKKKTRLISYEINSHLLKADAAFSANYHALLASVFRLNVASKLPLFSRKALWKSIEFINVSN